MWRGSRRTKTPTPVRTPTVKKSHNARSKLTRSKVAQKRVKLRALQLALGVVVITVLIGALSWVSFLEVLAVQTILVKGNEEIKTRAIESQLLTATAQSALGLFSRQNTITYPSTELENMLAFEFPKIRTVLVDPQPIQKQVSVWITERQPVAQWCRGEEVARECYYVDEEGFVYEKSDKEDMSMLIYEGGIEEGQSTIIRSYIAPQHFQQTRNFVQNLESQNLKVLKLFFEGEDARLTLVPGWELRVALDKDLGATAFNLDAVLEDFELRDTLSDILYIDMRFDERVYYKLHEPTDNEE